MLGAAAGLGDAGVWSASGPAEWSAALLVLERPKRQRL